VTLPLRSLPTFKHLHDTIVDLDTASCFFQLSKTHYVTFQGRDEV
jgi:hypothetical protein